MPASPSQRKALPLNPDPTLHVGRPNIADPERFLERAREILDRRWLSNQGPVVTEFERLIAAYLDVRHCICVCNATVGLEIAIRAVGIHGEAIVPSFTFVATAHALQWQEITPVFADIDPSTHNIDPTRIERHITPRTTGLLATHVWGRPCPIEALEDICQRHKLALLFDAAHAFGCSHAGRMVGGFGRAEVFSFHATKFLNAFEGGAITTNDDALAKKIRLMTNFGFSGYDTVIHLGTNGKMSEISAAMGLTNLEHIDELLAANLRNHRTYSESFASIPGIHLMDFPGAERRNYQYCVAELDSEHVARRDALVEFLHARGILARRYFWPGCHRMEPYRSLYPYASSLLPDTEAVAARTLILPTGNSISTADIHRVCSTIQEFLHG